MNLLSKLQLLFFLILGMLLANCSSSVTDPQLSTGLLGDDYFGETILPDEEDLAPPGLSLLNFKGGEYVRSGSDQEVRWILIPESVNDYGLFSSRIEYSDDMGSNWKSIPGADRIPALSGSAVSYKWRIPELNGGNQFLLRVTIKNASGEERSTQSGHPFTLDNEPPVIKENSLLVNGGQEIKKSYFFYNVGFTDSISPILFVCAKNLNKNSQESIIPNELDPCWKNVAELNKVADKNLNLENVFYVVGFLPGDYVFRVWAKDQAGNISVLRSGLGQDGIDKKEYTYVPAKAIQFEKTLFANTNNASIPPTNSQQDFKSAGATVFLQYKTDDVPISKEVSISTDGGMSYSPPITTSDGCAAQTGYVFCLSFPYQTNETFLVKIKVVSVLGMVSTAVSPPLNADKLRLIAGNLDNGLGGSASTAGYYPSGNSSLVIDSKSRAYINDSRRGILLLNPDNGSVTVFLKKDSSKISQGDGGSVAEATTNGIYNITIDYKDRILIVESDRIRRVETDGTISTLIGGGGPTGINFFPVQGCLRGDFVAENAIYKVNSTGGLLLNNIDQQNRDSLLTDPNYKIKKENIFYESEFPHLKINFWASSACGFGSKPTITPLPNGDIYFEGFHSREIAFGRGNYITQNNRGAGPTWYAYYSAPTAAKGAEIRILSFKGTGSLNHQISNDQSRGFGTLFPNQTFETAFPLSNPQLTFNYQTSKLLNIHSRGCIHYDSLCKDYYLSMNYSPKSGNSVGEGTQYIPETWWGGGRLITSRKGELYSLNRYNMGLYKYMASTNKFERILGTGAFGQCEEGTKALECSIDIQDAFVDDNDNIYFFDRDRLRVLVKKSSNYKDSIVVSLFGFSKSQGDYEASQPLLGDSLSARFNSIRSISLHSSGTKILVHDNAEALVREFSIDPADVLKYKMFRIAGNVFRTNAPTYDGSLVSNELATDAVLNFNSGVYADLEGNIYSRAGQNVFSRLNRTGSKAGLWEVILGSPSSTPAKKIYEMGTNSCDADVYSPTACDAGNRGYEIQGILPIEGTPNPFVLFSTWTWYQYDRQGGLKLTQTKPDGTQLVRNLTMGSWDTGIGYNYPANGTVLGGTTEFARFAPKSQYQDVSGTGYIYTSAHESWLNDRRIRYLTLNRDGSNRVTSGGKVGTLLSNLESTVRSFHIIYDAAKDSKFEAYVCLANGRLNKYVFNNAMSSHTGSTAMETGLVVTNIKLPTNYQCSGYTIEYSASEKKLFFPVSFDGLMGVAELSL